MPQRIRNLILAPLAIALAAVTVTSGAGAADPIPGSQGTNTAIPPTDSAETFYGRDQYEDLAITVNQTENLTNQAVSITWTGGSPTLTGPGRFAGNFLQIMQCWGDPDPVEFAENPGPPPEQCVQGAVTGSYGGVSGAVVPAGDATTRVISSASWTNFDPDVGFVDTSTGASWRPFRAVGGEVVNRSVDPDFAPGRGNSSYWLNAYFNLITTNEIAGAATGPDGTGAELFQVLTGVQSSGLGCGQRVQPVAGAGPKVPQCWIVVVPRGTPGEENLGTPFGERADNFGVYTSPLSTSAWQNRIAIPIDFNPVDSPCSLAATGRRIAGNELLARAIASWQPSLCQGEGLPPFSYSPVGDFSARQILANASPTSPGMVAISQPIDPATVAPTNPIVYAPLTVSGIVIGLNVERNPRFDAPEAAQQLSGIRIADLNLTPRLVAKLLTQSYTRQLEIVQPPDYGWLPTNPAHLGVDPDFLRFNPEFEMLGIYEGRSFSGLQLPAGTSDAAGQLWAWLLSDPEAASWLGGTADEWGMTVNPVYSTNPAVNPSGFAFGEPLPNTFPKADPYCYQGAPRGDGSIVPPPLCGTDWMPYARSLDEAALRARTGFDGARIAENPYAQSSSDVWSRTVPQFLGRRAVLSLTDSPSAAQYGLQVARLSRAGDNGAARQFIEPNADTLTAGVAAMAAGTEPTVLVSSPTAPAPGAYPLTALTYAAVKPLTLDTPARSDYAAFLEYAIGEGQVRGLALGQLPGGYVPLPDELVQQTLVAARTVRELQAPPIDSTPPSPAPPVAPTSVAPASSTDAQPPATAQSSNRSRPASPTPTPTPAFVSEPVASTETPDNTVPSSSTSQPTPTTAEKGGSDPTAATPTQDVGAARIAVPLLGGVALLSALAALEVTKRPRRRHGIDEADQTGET